MGNFADRVERDLERRDRELWDEHEAGGHDGEPEPDCPRCWRDQREARESQPEFNGAFNRW